MAQDIEQLRDALREGDHDAFRRVVREMSEPLYRYVRPQAASAAQDVVQQTFIRLWKHRKRLKTHGSLRTYLFFIATNLVRDTQRREALRRKRENEAAEMQPTEDPGMKALARDAFEAAKQLSPELHEVVLLRYGQGFTAAETADALGIPEGTVKTRQRGAIAKLREKLLGAGALPAGLDLEQSMREGAKTSVKVPSSLITNMEALVMANVGTNAGTTAVILAAVFALLLLAGGAVAIGAGWLTGADQPISNRPISALDDNSAQISDGSTTHRPLDTSKDKNKTAPKPGDETVETGSNKTGKADGGEAKDAGTLEFTIRGRVVDDAGHGVGGAWVGVVPRRHGDSISTRFDKLGFDSAAGRAAKRSAQAGSGRLPDFKLEGDTRSATTDSAGYFKLDARGPAPESTSGISLQAWAPGYQNGRGVVRVSRSGPDQAEVNLSVFPIGRYLTFRLDPPVRANFQVSLSAKIGSETHGNSGPCEPGPDGRYQVSLDKECAQTMRFRVPGFALSELEVHDHGEQHVDAGVIKLGRGRTLSGIVVDVQDRPVGGTLVKMQGDFELIVESGADGRFEIKGADDQAQRLVARNAAYAEARLEVPAGEHDAEHLRITMLPGVSVEGSVCFRGKYVPQDMRKVQVVLRRDTGNGYSDEYRSILGSVTVDETGSFHFERIGPGDYTLRGGSGLARSPHVRVHVGDKPVHVDVVFGGGMQVSGRVIGKDGKPVVNVGIVLAGLEDGHLTGSTHSSTDSNGVYLFEDVEPGVYVVLVAGHDAAFDATLFTRRRVTVKDESATLDIDFSKGVPGNRVTGRITLDGQPCFDDFTLEGTGLNSGLWHVVADDQGSFEINGVPAGAYYFHASADKYKLATHRRVVRFDGWDGVCDVSTALTGGSLTVRLKGANLEPQRASILVRPVDDEELGPDMLQSMIGNNRAPDKNGELHFDHVVVGKYVVLATAPGFGMKSAVVEVNSKTDVELELSSTLSPLAVSLAAYDGEVTPESSPYCMLRVSALDMPGQPVISIEPAGLQVGGQLLSLQLAPGRYRLNVFGPPIVPHSEEFTVRADEASNVALTLHKAARLQLTLPAPPDVVIGALVTVTDAVSGKAVRITGRLNPIFTGVPQPQAGKRIDVGPLKAGSYRVEVRLRGYKPVTLEVTLERGQVMTRTLELQAE